MRKCDRCGKEKENIYFVPSLNQLIFGGFPHQYINTCDECERRIMTVVDRMVKQLAKGIV